jgi:transcriptional regulator with XRE-family HTH domain
MISSSQVRAAKALLRWSGEELASKAGVSLSTVRRVEAADGMPDSQSIKTIMAIKRALEDAGVEFIGSPDDRPGVRLK